VNHCHYGLYVQMPGLIGADSATLSTLL
jgi:hypothetical protein